MICFHTDICWLRLDFETFVNEAPSLTTEAVATIACSLDRKKYQAFCFFPIFLSGIRTT